MQMIQDALTDEQLERRKVEDAQQLRDCPERDAQDLQPAGQNRHTRRQEEALDRLGKALDLAALQQLRSTSTY